MPRALKPTREAYLHEGHRHLRRALKRHPGILDASEVLVVSIESDDTVLATRTVCLYRAQLKAILGELQWDDPVRFVSSFARIELALQRRRGRPSVPRTASRKRRTIPDDEVGRVLEALARRVWDSPDDLAPAMLALAIFCHSRLGHRPIEGECAALDGIWLVLRNAKANEDRALARERRIDLSAMSPLVRRAVASYIRLRPAMVARYGSDKRWYDAASEQFARLCESLGIERIAITSLRHVALASWKRAGLSPWLIAALAGHGSPHSAGRYYAKAGSGWQVDGLPQAEVARILMLEEREAMRVARRARASERPHPVQLPELPPDPPLLRRKARSADGSGASAWSAYAARQTAETARWARPSPPHPDVPRDELDPPQGRRI